MRLTGTEEFGPQDAGQKAASDGGGHQAPFDFQEQICDGGFGQFSLRVPEKDVGCSWNFLEGLFVEFSVGGFVIEEGIVGVDGAAGPAEGPAVGKGLDILVIECELAVGRKAETNALGAGGK